MTYRDLIEILKSLDKKDSLMAINDAGLVEARLGFIVIPITRYDNGKLVQTKPDIKVSGMPVENLPEKNYLCIFSTPAGDQRHVRKNTVDIESRADLWATYLESLPDTFLNQEIMFFSRCGNYGSNIITAMKGGIGKNTVGIAYNNQDGYINISTNRDKESNNNSIKIYCNETGQLPFLCGEAIIFDRYRESYYNDRSIYDPNPEQENADRPRLRMMAFDNQPDGGDEFDELDRIEELLNRARR